MSIGDWHSASKLDPGMSEADARFGLVSSGSAACMSRQVMLISRFSQMAGEDFYLCKNCSLEPPINAYIHRFSAKFRS